MLDRIEHAIEDIRSGKMVIVVDDEDRENEGDFIIAAQHATPEVINFMSKEGRGLICAALTEKRCAELELGPMVSSNTSLHETAFTVSVDLIGQGTTTGISAQDRAKTIQALVNPKTHPSELGRPGHISPLKAKTGGVLRRTGHTEAAVDLARLAGLEPAGVLVEVMNEDGTMARLPQLLEIAKKFGLKIISIKDLIDYRLKSDSLIEELVRVDMPTKYGHFTLVAFKEKNHRCRAPGIDQRQLDRRRSRINKGAQQLFYRRYSRQLPLRLRRSTAQSHANGRAGRQRNHTLYEPGGKRDRSCK
eukprot:Opistho-1_new@95850